jgi:hypothetical protein
MRHKLVAIHDTEHYQGYGSWEKKNNLSRLRTMAVANVPISGSVEGLVEGVAGGGRL